MLTQSQPPTDWLCSVITVEVEEIKIDLELKTDTYHLCKLYQYSFLM